MKKVVLLSGGLDSTTCLAVALQGTKPEDLLTLNMYYGQRHKREIESARAVAEYYGVELREMDISEIFKDSGCSLLLHSKEQVPEGTYVEQLKSRGGNPVSTYVPFRNGLMLSIATSIALSIGAFEVYFGAHKDDAEGNAYPDCSIDFKEAISSAIYSGSGGKIKIVAPFIKQRKTDIVRTGLALKVPYELTWSCYEGGEKPCGKCATCLDRAKAFENNGVEDPAL